MTSPDSKPAGGTAPAKTGSRKRQGISGIEIIAGALTLLWLTGSALFFLIVPGDDPTEQGGFRFVMTLLAIFLPVAMIWVAATAARASRIMREESMRLQTAIDSIRQAQIAQQQREALHQEPAVTKKLDEIAETTRNTETAVLTFQSARSRGTVSKPAAEEPMVDADLDQGKLALGTPAEDLAPPLPTADFIRALHFPETASDEEGFAALRRALQDRNASLLIQAAQDVLTLLSQEGIYMDDLRPDKARPEIWRAFAHGTRGRPVAALGGVRDRTSLTLSHARLKSDPIFRDAAHHFLRRFDQMFVEFEAVASDEEISDLGDTRTARAFMLLGRVAGTFD